MKCPIVRITIFAAMIISCKSIFGMASTQIYIENHYGAPIKFKIGNANSNAPEISVADQQRVLVGGFFHISQLSIRTTGTGSRYVSYFTELRPQLADITRERSANAGKDAIIIIKPSRSYQNWDIEIHWEKPDQSIEILEESKLIQSLPRRNTATEEFQTLERQNRAAAEQAKRAREARFGSAPANTKDTFLVETKLKNILNGSFGQNYAQKVRAINDYDYTKATSKGMQNLRTNLLKRIEETLEQTYHIESRRTADWQAPKLASNEELKENIDMLYRSLQRYINMGY